jgi:hypothetical protein
VSTLFSFNTYHLLVFPSASRNFENYSGPEIITSLPSSTFFRTTSFSKQHLYSTTIPPFNTYHLLVFPPAGRNSKTFSGQEILTSSLPSSTFSRTTSFSNQQHLHCTTTPSFNTYHLLVFPSAGRDFEKFSRQRILPSSTFSRTTSFSNQYLHSTTTPPSIINFINNLPRPSIATTTLIPLSSSKSTASFSLASRFYNILNISVEIFHWSHSHLTFAAQIRLQSHVLLRYC